MKRFARPTHIGLVAALAVALIAAFALVDSGKAGHLGAAKAAVANNSGNTTTPIKHVIVLFDENETFDHYYGTYPYAANTDGTTFCPAAGTPGLPGSSETINTELAAGDIPGSTLGAPITAGNCAAYAGVTPNPNAGGQALIARDPNAAGAAGTASAPNNAPNANEYPPQRIPATADVTCDNNHGYTGEQEAEDNGKMNEFIQYTSSSCQIPGVSGSDPGIGMDYYDGNTLTAMWNYAQNYAMSDNSWDAGFGPSFPGYVNSFGASTYSATMGTSLISNIDPANDIDAEGWLASGANIGDLLNAKGVTWGSFDAGFDNTNATSTDLDGGTYAQYPAGFDPAQYWQDTSNASHVAPASGAEIGNAGPANHSYDISAFNDALSGTAIAGSVPTLPAVSWVRPEETQDAHPGSSGPLDEQEFLTSTINKIEQSKYWPSTAIIVEYDDSDGYYDHQSPTENIYTASGALASSPSTNNILYNASTASADSTICNSTAAQAAAVANDAGSSVAAGMTNGELGGEAERCGPSQRLPFVVISPYAKQNYVDHSFTTQDSTLKFIEANWSLPTMGPATFDNLNQVGNLESFFNWDTPQQSEVLLDPTCNVSGVTVASNTCNNRSANAATDGATDAGFGSVQSTPAVPTAIPGAPVITARNPTISVPLSVKGTLDPNALIQDAGITTSDGTLKVDATGVNLTRPGVYTASVTATDDYTYDGLAQDIESLSPATVTVDVVPLITVPTTTLTYDASADPSAQQILSDSGASIDGGSLDTPTIPSGCDLTQVGSCQVQITGSSNGQEAVPVAVTVNVIADPQITLQNPTISYAVGQTPTPAQVLADAGAQITAGSLTSPDLSGVKFGQAGTYTVNVTGGVGAYTAPPQQLTIDVVSRPAITVGVASVAYVVGSTPTAGQIAQAAGVSANEGTPTLDLDGSVNGDQVVNFDQPGSYQVTVEDAYQGYNASPMTFDVDVISQPVVQLGSSTISVPVGSALDSDQALTAADASVPDGGTLAQVGLGGVDFNTAGSYQVTVTGQVDGVTATPATLTIDVVAQASATVSVTDSQLTYPAGASVDEAEVISAAGASVSDSGDAFVDLSSVNFNQPGAYSVQITGVADGIAATPATVTITVTPQVSLQSSVVSYTAGAAPTGSAVLQAAGASTPAGTLSANVSGVPFSEAGTYEVPVKDSVHEVSGKTVLKVVVKPKLSVPHTRVTVARATPLTSALLLRKTGATLRGQGRDTLKVDVAHVKTRKPGTYGATIAAVGTSGKPVVSKSVRVVVSR